MSGRFKYDVDDAGVMVAAINRPKQGNAFVIAMYSELAAALQRAATDDKVKAVVVTGIGRFFSAGADVQEASQSDGSPAALATMQNNFRTGPQVLAQALIDFPKLTIAAVNGPVVGWPAAALGLFDVVYVASDATYRAPFLQLGLIPEACSSYTLPKTVGHAAAMDILLQGKVLNAEELVRLRIASRALPGGDGFHAAVLGEVRKQLKRNSLSSIVAAKALTRGPDRAALTAANEREAEAMCKRFASGEPTQRFRAVFEQLAAMKKAKL